MEPFRLIHFIIPGLNIAAVTALLSALRAIPNSERHQELLQRRLHVRGPSSDTTPYINIPPEDIKLSNTSFLDLESSMNCTKADLNDATHLKLMALSTFARSCFKETACDGRDIRCCTPDAPPSLTVCDGYDNRCYTRHGMLHLRIDIETQPQLLSLEVIDRLYEGRSRWHCTSHTNGFIDVHQELLARDCKRLVTEATSDVAPDMDFTPDNINQTQPHFLSLLEGFGRLNEVRPRCYCTSYTNGFITVRSELLQRDCM